MKPDPSISRRDFIKVSTNTLLTLSGLAGLGALVRFFSYEPAPETPTRFEVGSLESYPEGSRTLREEIPALIVNDAGSIAAYSLVCPHLGCTVEAGADGFTCPCHGSRFDADGKVLQGPAQKGLGRLRVEVIEGSVIVHTD